MTTDGDDPQDRTGSLKAALLRIKDVDYDAGVEVARAILTAIDEIGDLEAEVARRQAKFEELRTIYNKALDEWSSDRRQLLRLQSENQLLRVEIRQLKADTPNS